MSGENRLPSESCDSEISEPPNQGIYLRLYLDPPSNSLLDPKCPLFGTIYPLFEGTREGPGRVL